MHAILAQSTDLPAVPSEILKWVLIILVALLFIGAGIVGLVKMFGKPVTKIDDNPPPEFRKAAKRYNHDLAEQRYGDHERRIVALEARNAELIRKMDGDKREIVGAGDERERRIREDLESKHDENSRRLNEMEKSIGGLETATEMQNARLGALDRKMDGLPGELIATLKNTGAI